MRPGRSLSLCLGVWLSLAAGPSAAQTWLVDTFTGPDLLALSSHTPDLGQASSWVTFNGQALQLCANRLCPVAKNKDSIFVNTTPLGSPSYTVSVTATWDNSNPSNRVGLLARSSGSAGYLLTLMGSGNFLLVVLDAAGGSTLLASGNTPLSLNVPHLLTLTVSDNAKTAALDGLPFATSADNSLTAGSAGILLSWFTTVTAAVADDFVVSSGVPDAGSTFDAGPPPDAGQPQDAGPPMDAGSGADAGSTSDAGMPSDAGVTSDAGIPSDAGLSADAGPAPDAGAAVDAGEPGDGGTSTDGGPGAPQPGDPDGGVDVDPQLPWQLTVGCSCDAAASSGAALSALLLLAVRRGRPHRRPASRP